MKYKDGSLIQAGDVFTDGGEGREDVRRKIRGKILYVDKFNIVWMPINDFTVKAHNEVVRSYSFFFKHPQKVELGDLTTLELDMYNNSDEYLRP